MSSIKLFLFLFITLYSVATSNYSSFLSDVNSCMRSFNVRKYGADDYRYDKDQVNAAVSGQISSMAGCSNRQMIMTSAAIIREANDCAKTAVELRNKYLRSRSQRPIVSSRGLQNDINTMVVAQKWDALRFKKHFTHRQVDLHNPNDPHISGLKPGDLLFFENVNCLERFDRFKGHVMTVMGVNRDASGRPVSVQVLEGHTGGASPTYRTLAIEQILANGRGERLPQGTLPIPDISCCAFRGITTWNAEDQGPAPAGRGRTRERR